MSAQPVNRRDPSVQRMTTASQRVSGHRNGIRDGDASDVCRLQINDHVTGTAFVKAGLKTRLYVPFTNSSTIARNSSGFSSLG